jgi:lactate dehydrogenase-like 2-hydroxyacid dehydrogenase
MEELFLVPNKIPLLILNDLEAQHRERIALVYDVTYAPTLAERAAALRARGPEFRIVLTIGPIPFPVEDVAAMPALELVCCMGAGFDALPLAVLRARGIAIANGIGTSDDCVADHAFGLLIGVVRHIRMFDIKCRAGVWRDVIPHAPNVSRKKLGILGLGTIGLQIAKRAAGFDMPVGYHNRSPRQDTTHRYFDSVTALARWADVLVCATPGGPATHHLVNTEVLDALGPEGFLINVARGSVVDTNALALALREGRIAGAGLDVYESEPLRPEPLVGLDNVLLTPHVAGFSPESIQAGVSRFLENADGHFSGRGVVSPI